MSKSKQSQHKRFTIEGHWWLPQSDRKVAGDLRYVEEDMSLSLRGGLSHATAELPFGAIPASSEYAIVHGESTDGACITVLRPFYTNWTPDIRTLDNRSIATIPLRSSRLHCPVMLEGIHLSSTDETFSKCRIKIPYFDVWLGISPFEIDAGHSFKKIRLDYSSPSNDEFEIRNHDCRLRFVHSVTPPRLPLGSSPAIVHQSYLEIEPNAPKPFNWLLDVASEIINLLSFCYGGPLVSKRVTLHKQSTEHESISIYYPRHRVTIPDYGSLGFLIPYDQIKSSFEKVLNGWQDAPGTVKRATQMLIASEQRPSAFIELRFIPLAQAAEVLSSETEYSTIVDQAAFKEVRDRMLNALPDTVTSELSESITNCLGWANGRNLRGKLTGLLHGLQNDTCRLFAVDNARFIRGIVSTRNHYSHYSKGKRVLQRSELHWAIQKLSLMIRLIALIRAGVPEQDLQNMVRSHIRLARERVVWRDLSEEGSECSEDNSL